ncbi:MAG: rhomboid family intramembrane serine protease [Nanoarchaeota archaeon]
MDENKKQFKNIFYLGLPVLIVIGVFLMPKNIQNIFVLKLDMPTLWTWFTYIFIHEDFAHLFSNVVFYILPILFLFFICPKEYWKDFYKPFLVILFLVPALLFIFHNLLWFFDIIIIRYHRGFSGITSASLGMLGFFVVDNIKKFIIYYDNREKKNLIFFCFSIVLVISGIILLFPSDLTNPSGSIINIFSHFIGLVVGFFVGFVYFRLISGAYPAACCGTF